MSKPSLSAGDLPVNALSSQTSCSQQLLDVSEPVGSFQFTEPAVHVVWLVIASLHQLDEALLQDIKPLGTGKYCWKHKQEHRNQDMDHLAFVYCVYSFLSLWCFKNVSSHKIFRRKAKHCTAQELAAAPVILLHACVERFPKIKALREAEQGQTKSLLNLVACLQITEQY